MNGNDRQSSRNDLGPEPEVLTRVKRGHSSFSTDEGEQEVSSYTMFTIGIAAFSIGFWAIACLSKVMIDKGPLSILKMLAGALLGK